MSGLITNPYFKKFCTSPSDLPLSSAMLVLMVYPCFSTVVNNPTASELGNMVAILEIGAFSTSFAKSCPCTRNLSAYQDDSLLAFFIVTSLLSAHLSDTKGRRFTLFLGACIFTVGGAIQTLTMGYTMMLVGRIISGSGVGLLSSVVPMYQSEISPADHVSRKATACHQKR
jgi:MFS family permease